MQNMKTKLCLLSKYNVYKTYIYSKWMLIAEKHDINKGISYMLKEKVICKCNKVNSALSK